MSHEVEQKTPKQPASTDDLRDLCAAVAFLMGLVVMGVFVLGLCLVLCDSVDLYSSERQRVVDEIEQFRHQHGRYPKSLQEAGIVVVEALRCSEYEVTHDAFFIELTRPRFFPPGERIWIYTSKCGTWSSHSETW